MTSISVPVSISLQDYFLNPRTSWEMTGEKELFDELLSSISGITDVSNVFSSFSIIYPLGSNIPRYINKRLAGSYGTSRQKSLELESLSKHGIVKKERYELKTIPEGFLNFPYIVGGESLIEYIPNEKNKSDIISSIERCIERRNVLRIMNNIPIHRLVRGRIVYDEFTMILQILRAKLIMIN